MRRFLLLAVAVAALGGPRLAGQVQFTGFFLTQADARFTLCDASGTVHSDWLGIGDSFHGYTLASFDAKREVLSVEKGGRTLQMTLRDSKTKEAPRTVSGTITLLSDGSSRKFQASFVLGEEQSFPLRPGLELRLTAQPQADGNLRYKAHFVASAADGKKTVSDWPDMISPPGQEFAISEGSVSFSFKP